MEKNIGNEALTKRELEILKLLITEKSNLQIANFLHLSVNTVETHRKNIMKKLKIKSILGLFHWAVKNEIYI